MKDINTQTSSIPYKNILSLENITSLKDAEKSVLNICESLSTDCNKFETEIKEVENLLSNHIKTYDRFTYSSISKYMFDNPNLRETIFSNVDTLYEQCSEENKRYIFKLWDHVNLVSLQIDNLQLNQEQFHDRFNFEIPIITDKVNEKLESTNAQLISLVAIFTALAFLVFGSITSFESIFTNIQNTSLLKLIILASLWGIAILNIIAAFMFFISKVTGKSFSNSRDETASLFKRYPFLILGNYILSIILTFSCCIYLMAYRISQITEITVIFTENINRLAIIVVESIFIIFIYLLSFKKRKTKNG